MKLPTSLLAGLLLCRASGAAGEVELPSPLRLPQALDIALKQSGVLRRAGAQLQQARGRAGQTRAAWYPQLSAGLQDSGQTINLKALGIGVNIPFLPTKVGPFETFDARASVSQNVLNLPLLHNDKASRLQLDSAEARAANARELLVYQVAVAFSQALRAQQQHATLREQTELSRKLASITEERFREGLASMVELTRSRQQVSNLEQVLSEAENTLTSAKVQLAALLNARVTADYELDDQAPGAAASPPSQEEALRQAFAARSDYRAARLQVQAAEQRLAAVKAQRLPVVQFRADIGQSGNSITSNINTFRVAGAVSFPIYTGGRIEGEITEEHGRLEEARSALDEVSSQVSAEVLAALTAIRTARRQLEVSAEAVGLAREEVELATLRFQDGVADNTEIVNAQDRLSRAEDARVRARFQWSLAETALHRSIGDIDRFYASGRAK